jgi:hypothetical protein
LPASNQPLGTTANFFSHTIKVTLKKTTCDVERCCHIEIVTAVLEKYVRQTALENSGNSPDSINQGLALDFFWSNST